MTDFNGIDVAVIGLGISNTPLIEFLLERGARVTARDFKEFDKLNDKVRAYRDRGVKFVCGSGYLDGITEDVIFKAPGIRSDKPELVAAKERGAVLTSEMELFFELCPCKIIGVTGSDGKTTTTTLIYKMLSHKFGEDKVFVGGNIGKPLLPELSKMDENCFAVVELSSFQLNSMRSSPDICVITNVSPNHLDWHTGMEEYIESKENIFRFMKPGSRAVFNKKNAVTAAMVSKVPEGVVAATFCGGDVYEKDGVIFDGNESVMQTSDILIPGRHNVENYMAAICTLHGIVGCRDIVEIARTFGGVEHRIELVREFGGVKYYNSSIDSSPTRTAAALRSFSQKLIVICGGYDKHIPFEPLAEPLCERAKTVVLTGATAAKIKSALVKSPFYRDGAPKIIDAPDFESAVIAAKDEAKPGDTVILSPACASFDAFPNFEVRGNTFKEIVKGFK